MRKRLTILAVAICCLPLVCLASCATTLENYGEVGIRYGTEITLFSRASKTCDEEATSALSIDPEIVGVFKPAAPVAEPMSEPE
jgi:hypothetical protein